MSDWRVFKLLLWKNFVIQRRHKFQTFLEIVIPVIFASLLLVLRHLVTPTYHETTLKFPKFECNSIKQLRELTVRKKTEWKIAYSPLNDIYEGLLKDSIELIEGGNELKIEGFANGTVLERHLANHSAFVGVEFPDSHQNITFLPLDLQFSLRFPAELRFIPRGMPVERYNWFTSKLFPTFPEYGPRNFNDTDGGLPPGYCQEGFLPLQTAISRAFVRLKRQEMTENEEKVNKIYLQRFPHPPFVADQLLSGLELVLPLIILLSFLSSVVNVARHVNYEKEQRLKEAMMTMGISNNMHWAAFFVKNLQILSLTVVLLTTLLKIPIKDDASVLTRSNWGVLFFVLFIYCIPSIVFCFLTSVFFTKGNVAALASGILWLISYAPYAITMSSDNSIFAKSMICLSSNSAIAMALQLIIRFEGTGEGLQWKNLFRHVAPGDNFTVGYCLVMMLLDSVIYLVFTLYFERILVSGSSVPEKWYFPIEQFWSKRYKSVDLEMDEGDFPPISNAEDDFTGKISGITLKNLRKTYPDGKTAVTGLTLNMYRDQITVLLGHNGAGKSTVMSMLTGLLEPTSGTAIVNGYDIRSDMKRIQKSFGLCPQYNILFEDLTVREHIYFYASLKGISKAKIEAEIAKFVKKIELTDKLDELSKNLSGGQKRKLLVVLSLVGDSKIVLLDEPSSALDPSARRALWELLCEEKQGRTILLTTHFMEEAEVLGDRIAILNEGNLECVGSSFYLKKKYATGYRLICVKRCGCDATFVTALLRKYIPEIEVETDIGTELTYVLNEFYTSMFRQIFEDLENNMDSLSIASFGVSLSTLEDVFMKVGSNTKMNLPDAIPMTRTHSVEENLNPVSKNYGSTNTVEDLIPQLLTGTSLIINQIKAVFLKKFAFTRRSPILLLVMMIMPVIFVQIAVLAVNSLRNKEDLPSLELELRSYGKTVTMVQSNLDDTSSIINSYKSFVEEMDVKNEVQIIESSMEEHILSISTQDIHKLNSQYLIGASIEQKVENRTEIVAWFNNNAYHTAPIALNAVFNTILKEICAECSIQVTNKPLPYSSMSKKNVLIQGNGFGYQLAYNTTFALCFLSGFFSIFYLKERATRSKLLQLLSGLNISVYWIVSFIFDFLLFSICGVFYIGTIALSQEEGWSTMIHAGRLAVLWATFVWAALPMTYVGSFMYKNPTTGFVKITMSFLLNGAMTFFLISIIFALKINVDTEIMKQIFMMFPHFAVADALNTIDYIIVTKGICQSECEQHEGCNDQVLCLIMPSCCEKMDFFAYEYPGMGKHLVKMMTSGVISWIIIILIEVLRRKNFNFFTKNHLQSNEIDQNIDCDVLEEKRLVKRLKEKELSQYNLVIKDLKKTYGSYVAVKDMCVAVNNDDCFGLLGLNGAGKTSTFKMLTGEVKIAQGDAFIQGISLKTDMPKASQLIGYVPQYDAMLQELTGYETLRVFALLRGVPSPEIHNMILTIAAELNFKQHLNKQIKNYSGGNKRKVSAAIALLGNPSILFFDEPTAGMDIAARRLLWRKIWKLRDEGRSVVLTSHSMEECENLCTKIAIMVKGEFRCLGSVQHLKNKFSKGYTLKIKLRRNPVICHSLEGSEEFEGRNIKEYVEKCFVGSQLREEHSEMLTYHLPQTTLKWSELFGLMEIAKSKYDIEDYSLGQTSLEQIFLYFARSQAMAELERVNNDDEWTRL
ncbi:phospholipid-transporting ATPase ABCA3-like [Culicoides brevitarsis]|uniref:phospholipid-transporting ATPase ABCA3-like n=1 Tax=Culicoides brevitarsis TaxID=469753 RepID=UPI00307BEB8C